MKYYIIAGEASGDLHAARLIEALHQQDPSAEIRCWGGDLMEQAGATLVKHYSDLAFMGFWEVVKHLGTILENIRFCKQDITRFHPDIIVYVDYPGFNLRIAKWAKKQGYKNHYYISPQLWAWKENRIHQMKANLEALYVILPFEQQYFKERHNYSVEYVGHPLLESVAKAKVPKGFLAQHQLDEKRPIVALLPGSRRQEIKTMLPLFLACIPQFPNHQFVVAGAPGIPKPWYQELLENTPCTFVHNETYALLQHSAAALVTSGTATLETALFNVPQVVCYRTSFFSYQIAKRVVQLDAIALVNLIMGKHIIEELIQNDCTPGKITSSLEYILSPQGSTQIKADYALLRKKLNVGSASTRTAKAIYAATQV